MNARLTVLSGPSGVGKGSVVEALRRRHPEIWVSISATTRAPRPGEVDGVAYHFLTPEQFAERVAAGEFLEHADYAGHRYGTPRHPIDERLNAGVPVLLEIDLQGALQVRTALPEALLVFLAPPSFAELARRLAGRATETPADYRNRLAIARRELAHEDRFDVTVTNDAIESAADRLVALVTAPPAPPEGER
ncbi:MAG: guanylate kinase [Mycobacteriales bacterium]